MRSQRLDLLRGIAVLLIVIYHDKTIPFISSYGWIGVDLFFVLSGYLVSNLLFKEYTLQGQIKPIHFLVRRGFKIYPVFYFFIIITIIAKLAFKESISHFNLFAESVFMGNYLGGIWGHTWSLCVEEHFYFILAFVVFFLIKKKQIENCRKMNFLIIAVCIFCLLLRLMNYYVVNHYGVSILFNQWAVYAQTHNRIDSLLAGVGIAYNLHFQRDKVEALFGKIKPFLVIVLPLLLLPYILKVPDVIIANVFLYIINYVFFGLVLLNALLSKPKEKPVKPQQYQQFFALFFRAVAFVGINSYAIYLIDPFVIKYVLRPLDIYNLFTHVTATVIAGFLITTGIEKPFLKIRDKYFPPRDRKKVQLVTAI